MEGKIYKQIIKTMEDVGAIGKKDKNEYDKYMFRGIDAVMNALHPAMVKNGIFVVPQVLDSHREERSGKNGTVMMYTILTVKYTFMADDGSSVEAVVIGEAMDRSDKSTNKAMSAAFKYACFQTFCIPTDEMKDADAESPEIGKKVEKVSEDWIRAIEAECKRIGKDKKDIYSVYKITEDAQVTPEIFKDMMNRFEATEAKK